MCNNCQNTTCHDCNQQPLCETNDCSCPVKDLSTDCILYTGGDLECSGIKDKTILTELIQQLDNFICTQTGAGIEFLSIGEGEPVYAGVDPTGKQKIRTIKTENSGEQVATILKDVDYDTQNGLLIIAKSLKSETLTFSDDGDNISINSPTNALVKTFYVDPYSSASEETGSRAKPFRSLEAAFDAFIDAPNGGTILQPIWGYSGVIELLNDVNVFSDIMLSINRLHIEGNGHLIGYYGHQDYFISTKYLVDLDAKSIGGKLDNDIKMTFNDVRFVSAYTNKILHNLAYVSPTTPGYQNNSGMKITKCEFSDRTEFGTYGSYYIDTGIPFFGTTVKLQNSIPSGYMMKNENVAWFGDGTLTLEDCKLFPESQTALYIKNATHHIGNLEINFNSSYANYGTLVGSNYSPSNTANYITLENDFPISGVGRNQTWCMVDNFTQSYQVPPQGGQNAFIKTIGNSIFLSRGANFYSENVNNIVQVDSDLGLVELVNFKGQSIYPQDGTYGAFKHTGTPATQKYIYVDGSNIRSVKTGIPLTNYILPTAGFANINGAMFNTQVSYPNNAAAISGGLIPGCMYYNTTTQSITKIT